MRHAARWRDEAVYRISHCTTNPAANAGEAAMKAMGRSFRPVSCWQAIWNGISGTHIASTADLRVLNMG